MLLRAGSKAQGAFPGMWRPEIIPSYPLQLAERFTTNLIFPYPVVTVDLGTADVLGKRLGRNVVLLKANRRGFAATNVSVYLANGTLYSFGVQWADSPVSWNYCFGQSGGIRFGPLPSLPELDSVAAAVNRAPAFLRVGASEGKVYLMLKRVYYTDSLLWLGFAARNRSSIPFEPGLLRFSVEDRKRVKRTAMQSIPLDIAFAPGFEPLPGGSRTRLVVGIPPFTITRRKILLVEWAEPGNGRRILLRVKGRDILKARKLSEER